ncbi:MAG: hypothetical protein A7315_03155 [Candidatus Altiarchaeales archaeon WOR_SM1_79]|nr:MAG: hypothetical protein A7315_03155 [Candidatus Altiarchaeales archaeon WOR_SM1_79]
MDNNVLIGDILKLKDFDPVLDLKEIEGKEEQLIDGYVVTQEIRTAFEYIAEAITRWRHEKLRKEWGWSTDSKYKSFLITGSYGTGKSYFLSILSIILESLDDEELFRHYRRHFDKYPEIQSQFDKLKEKGRFLSIRIRADLEADKGFKDMLLYNLNHELEKLGDVPLIKTEFENAIEILKDLENDGSISNFKENIDHDSNKISYEELKEKIKKYNKEYLELFKHIYQKAYKAEPLLTKGFDLNKILKDAEKIIKDNGYYGILFYIDELFSYLASSGSRVSSDIREIGLFAEFVKKKENNVWAICAMQKTKSGMMPHIVREKGDEGQFNQILGGRFQELRIKQFEVEKIITDLIQISDKNKKIFETEIRDIEDQYNKLNEIIKEYGWENVDALSIYPFHPAVVYYLPNFSYFSQETRSIFQFVQEEIGKIQSEPLIVNGKLNLITFDQLFEYFKKTPDIENDGPLNEAYNNLMSFKETELDKKIIDILSGLVVISRAREEKTVKISKSAEELSRWLNYEEHEIKSSLEKLNKSRYLIHDEDNDEYYLSSKPIPDVSEAIQKEAEGIDPCDELIKLLKKEIGEEYSDRNIYPYSRASIFKVDRKIYIKYNIDTSLAEKSDGVLVFMIPPDFKKDFDVNKISEDIGCRDMPKNIVFAIPKKWDMFSEKDLQSVGAVEKILSGVKYEDEYEGKGYKKEKIKYDERVKKQVSEFINADNFIFVTGYGELPQNLQNPIDDSVIANIFDFVLRKYYNKFPETKRDEKYGRPATNGMIGKFIEPGEKEFHPKRKDRVDNNIVDTLVPLGFAKKDKPKKSGFLKYKFSEPTKDNGNSKEIWDLIDEKCDVKDIQKIDDDDLRRRKYKEYRKIQLADLYKILCDAPYGLNDEFIELYLAAYIKSGGVQFYKERVPVKDEPLVNIVQNITKDTKKPEDKRIYHLRKGKNLDDNTEWYTRNLGNLICDEKDKYNRLMPKNITYNPEKQSEINEQLSNDLGTYNEKIRNNMQNINEFLDGETFDELCHVKVLSEGIEKVIDIEDEYEFFEELKKLPSGTSLLQDKLKPETKDYYNALEKIIDANNKFCEFSDEYDKIKIIMQRIDNLSYIDDYKDKDYDEIKNKKKELLGLINQNKEEIVLNKDKRKELFEKARKFWLSYVKKYYREHDTISEKRDKFGDDILDSDEFEFLKALSKLKFSDIETSDDILVKIKEIQRKACEDKEIINTLGDIETSKSEKCEKCNYKLGGGKELIDEMGKGEKIKSNAVKGAIKSRLNKILEIENDFTLFLKDHDIDKIKDWAELTKLVKGIKDDKKYDVGISKKRGSLIDELSDLINEWLSGEGEDIVDIGPVQLTLNDFIEDFKIDLSGSGKKLVTLGELEEILKEKIKKWKEDHGEDIKIAI